MIESIKSVSTIFTANPLSGVTGESSTNATGALAGGAEPSMSFAKVMGDVTQDAIDTLKLSETKSFEGIQGKASTREVVDAVMNAEQSLQTAIAIRDKVVTAYLEVARMQI